MFLFKKRTTLPRPGVAVIKRQCLFQTVYWPMDLLPQSQSVQLVANTMKLLVVAMLTMMMTAALTMMVVGWIIGLTLVRAGGEVVGGCSWPIIAIIILNWPTDHMNWLSELTISNDHNNWSSSACHFSWSFLLTGKCHKLKLLHFFVDFNYFGLHHIINFFIFFSILTCQSHISQVLLKVYYSLSHSLTH